jgi:hypothetical protein
MFYLWDSVFARDKKPLENLLSNEGNSIKLTQYSDFLDLMDSFMEKIYKFGSANYDDDDDVNYVNDSSDDF